MRRRPLIIAASCMVACAVGTGFTSVVVATTPGASYQPSYDDHDRLNPALLATMRTFATTMSDDPRSAWLDAHTEVGDRTRMHRFLARYGGRPVEHVLTTAGGDQVAIETLTVRCSSTSDRVELVWAWRDGTWRSHPGFTASRFGQPVDYPGCR